MSLGLVGRKVGMTRIFTAEGDSIPVTVLDVSDNRVTQIKTVETDGYTAVQVAFGTRRASHGNSRSHNVPGSIGKGYAGTIKRYNFASGRASHGNSRSHNVPGSIGMAQDPGRVFPGKRMTGHMGDETVTVQNLEIARIDAERKLLLVKGAVPGAKGGKVFVTPAVKAPAAKGAK